MSEYQRLTNSVVDFTAFPTDPIEDERHDVLVGLFFEEQDLPETPSITGSGASMTFTIGADTVPLAEWREIACGGWRRSAPRAPSARTRR